jgi:hypothetical protein
MVLNAIPAMAKTKRGQDLRRRYRSLPPDSSRKSSHTAIGGQFEYNAYIRAFFADNPGKTLDEAIACWKYQKAQLGSHGYSSDDLAALESDSSVE